MSASIRYTSFPRTRPPPSFVPAVVAAFRQNEAAISTVTLKKGLESNRVLTSIAEGLASIGFQVESGKQAGETLGRPVFFGEDGEPSLRYEIDAYHPDWRCGLEVEAGRAILGNAVFRDLFQAMVMVDVDHLCLAVPLTYKYQNKGKGMANRCYEKTVSVADALFGHSRMAMPFGLTVIGY